MIVKKKRRQHICVLKSVANNNCINLNMARVLQWELGLHWGFCASNSGVSTDGSFSRSCGLSRSSSSMRISRRRVL